jgi:hypothetical protein
MPPAAPEPHHGFAAAQSELYLGKGNHRGIADSNRLADHAADLQFRNQLVEIRQRLG